VLVPTLLHHAFDGSSTPWDFWKTSSVAHYRKPGWFTQQVFNRIVAGLTAMGISVWGSRVLRVKGRRSGEWRSTPVNLLTYEGHRYLVAPRGETQWVRNLRAAGTGELVLGRRAQAFQAAEIPDEDKIPILREYLKRWKAEVGTFFEGTSASSPNEELRRIAPKHPVFRVDNA
jgi:deazaflavin-dependent oxidoreductase (nitroreductase family)